MNIQAQPNATKPLSFRLGALVGLLVFFASVGGLILLSSLKSHLGSMPAGTDQGWPSYDFMHDHITALSWAWTILCLALPATHLIRRRQWRGLKGMLLVSGVTLLALLCFLLYAAALSSGLAAVTG